MGDADLGLRVELLGEVRIRLAGEDVAVGPPRQRAVLAALALRPNQSVSRAELIDGVWGDTAPPSVEGSVHTYIHGLRRVLAGAGGGDLLVRSGAGYRLVLEPSAVDVVAAETGMRRARELASPGNTAAAVDVLEECLRLWRGTPLFGLPGPLAQTERVRLGELRLELLEERAEWLLDLGRHREVIGELGEAVAAEPFRERLRGLLMLALHRGGRRADALAEFGAARRLFAAELGLEPGPALADLQLRILRSDPGLDLPAESPAAGVPAQLPHDVPDFVGRAGELKQLARWRAELDRGGRALVISAVGGVGGVGKTSLAVRFARDVAADYPDGQLYVNLRGFDPHRAPLSAAEALGQLLSALGTGGRRQDADVQAALYRTLLSDKRMLIVLDNAASADQVRLLLPGPSRCLVLVTSRNRLTGLVVRDGARRLTLEGLPDEEALDLLRVTVGPRRIDAEPAAAAELIRLCGSLPLALRVAAEKVSSDPEAGLEELVGALIAERSRLDALDSGDDEMSSVRGVFSWSYHSLKPAAARAFRLLGVVPGPDIAVEAAAALLDRRVGETAELLTVLCEQNLLERREEDRYGFHDLLRDYAAELADREETAANRAAALHGLMLWYVHSLRSAYSGIMPDFRFFATGLAETEHEFFATGLAETEHEVAKFGSRDDVAGWQKAEAANLLALAKHADDTGEHQAAWQLAWGMYHHYYSAGRLSEWVELLEIAMHSAEQLADPMPRLRILNEFSVANSRIGRNDVAVEQLKQALEIARATDDHYSQVKILINLSSTLREMKLFEQGISHAKEAMKLFEQGISHAKEATELTVEMDSTRDYYRAGAFDALCELYVESGKPAEALRFGLSGLEAARACKSELIEDNILVNLAHAHRDLGDVAVAIRDYESALDVCGQRGDRYHEALALFGLAELHRREARLPEARERAQRALDIFVGLDGEEADEMRTFLRELESPGPTGG
ncbi:BTAD domain-containing putative transcriptional regulator [Amycolatopsis sp. NPDC051061]|uniref:AfsR/SARP family transcriptional regulator n=1 Tax=Amycolatopsis sp. NPDC051061 TaxID=3155042 RepID=UPI0034454A94